MMKFQQAPVSIKTKPTPWCTIRFGANASYCSMRTQVNTSHQLALLFKLWSLYWQQGFDTTAACDNDNELSRH